MAETAVSVWKKGIHLRFPDLCCAAASCGPAYYFRTPSSEVCEPGRAGGCIVSVNRVLQLQGPGSSTNGCQASKQHPSEKMGFRPTNRFCFFTISISFSLKKIPSPGFTAMDFISWLRAEEVLLYEHIFRRYKFQFILPKTQKKQINTKKAIFWFAKSTDSFPVTKTACQL